MKQKSQPWLGVAVGPRAIEVAEVVADAGGESRVVRCETFAVEAPPPAEDNAPAAAAAWPVESLRAFCSKRGVQTPAVVSGLDSANILCRVITLPTASDAELRPMLELQLENLSPLPPEQVVCGYEVLNRTEKQSDVFVALARRDKVVERLDALRQAGVAPDALDLDPLALLAWLRHRQALPAAEMNQLALVALEDEAATVLLTAGGKPQCVAAVPLQGIGGNTPEELAAAAADLISAELRLAVAAAQAEQPDAQWPRVRVLQRASAGSAAASLDPARVAAELAFRLGLACEPLALHRPVSIAEGLCLRRAADGAAVAAMNLMPPDLMAAKQRAARRRLVRLAGIGLALVYAVCVAAAVGGFAWRMTELGSLQGQAAELTKNRDRVRALQTELKLLQDRVSDHSVPLECLVEIVGIKPEGVFLTEFNFQDGEQLTLSGYAPTATAVTDEFNPKLEKSKWFPGGTKMAPLVTQKIKGNEVVRFSIQCFLQKQAGASRRAGSHRR